MQKWMYCSNFSETYTCLESSQCLTSGIDELIFLVKDTESCDWENITNFKSIAEDVVEYTVEFDEISTAGDGLFVDQGILRFKVI